LIAVPIVVLLLAVATTLALANTVAPMEYPANAASPLIQPAAALAKVFPGQPGASIKLEQFGQVDEIASGHVRLFTVAAGRMVYEIRLTFTAPLTYRGITWSSGAHEVIMDAETGDILMGGISGTVTSSPRWMPTPPH